MTSVLVTGGTGSLGTALVSHLLTCNLADRVCVYSRDEVKQAQMAQRFPDPRVRFFLGDVRDVDRLEQACVGVDVVVAAAALKRVDKTAYDPSEVIKTNIYGTHNTIEAARRCGVKKVVVISSDKAVQPTNIYGATKMCAEWLAVTSNAYTHPQGTRVSVVRYGNVIGSRGSVVEVWRNAVKNHEPLTLTDDRCTRFWISMQQAVELVLYAVEHMDGGEIFVPKLPSMKLVDLADAVAGVGYPRTWTGLRPGGEKLHEKLLNEDEVTRTIRTPWCYIVNPALPYWGGMQWVGEPLPKDFVYESNVNSQWLTVDDMRTLT